MFLRKVDGLRAVTLPDGTIMTRADLPPKSINRWVASRKVAVVRGVLSGLISKEEAQEMYGLSGEELDCWTTSATSFGLDGLKATQIQKHRQRSEGHYTQP